MITQGAVLPRAFSKYSQRRRISVDVYRIRVTQPAEVSIFSSISPNLHDASENAKLQGGGNQTLINAGNASYYDECVVR
jgi:hypothetical protein